MALGSTFSTRSRQLAFVLLLFFGLAVMILGLIVLGVGLAITHNDTFHETIGLKEHIESTVDYVQYWVGFPYVVAGLLVACSAVNLRKISLTVVTILFSLISVVLSLAGLVVDGPDFVSWKNTREKQRYWEGQDGYACTSVEDTCTCERDSSTQKTILSFADCETLMKLSSVYGVMIGCFIFGLVLLLASVFIIVYIVTSEREKARREGSAYFSTTNAVVEETRAEPMFDHPVVGQNNPGYEYPVAPPAVEPPPKPAPYREYKQSTTPTESANRQHDDDDASTIVDNGGVVMMDPGRFRLGDDDIY